MQLDTLERLGNLEYLLLSTAPPSQLNVLVVITLVTFLSAESKKLPVPKLTQFPYAPTHSSQFQRLDILTKGPLGQDGTPIGPLITRTIMQ
jgi:hypothetical protein